MTDAKPGDCARCVCRTDLQILLLPFVSGSDVQCLACMRGDLVAVIPHCAMPATGTMPPFPNLGVDSHVDMGPTVLRTPQR